MRVGHPPRILRSAVSLLTVLVVQNQENLLGETNSTRYHKDLRIFGTPNLLASSGHPVADLSSGHDRVPQQLLSHKGLLPRHLALSTSHLIKPPRRSHKTP